MTETTERLRGPIGLVTEIEELRARMKEAAAAIEDGDYDAALIMLRAGKARLKP